MAKAIHLIILATELVFLFLGIKFWREKSSAWKKIILAMCVFGITFVLYLMPYVAGYGEIDKYATLLVYIPECLSATIKQLVGESRIEFVANYMIKYKLYALDFYLAVILSLMVTFSTALSAFKDRINNYFRCAKLMKADVCDIVVGQSKLALEYATLNKNTIIFVDKLEFGDEEDINYIESGYTVLNKKFSVSLLNSKLFNKDTKYNFIMLDTNNSFFDYYNFVSMYLEQEQIRDNFYFYFEMNETAVGVLQDHIANDKRNIHSKFVRLFSTNELLARKFVEENPITAYMPTSFFENDTSVKKDVVINVMMLGFGALSKEIYNQFVINNQLVEYSDGEYKAHTINYTIYSSWADENAWNINGLKNSIENLEEKKASYFPLPELPYNTTVVKEDTFEIIQLAKMCKKASQQNSITYFIVDVGDTYKNIEICDNINQLMNYSGNFHIFVYNDGVNIQNENNVTSYGNLKEIVTNGLIINDELIRLAKRTHEYYNEQKTANPEAKQGNEEKPKELQELPYFDLYSNIYLANSLRFKLNLLGLDYKKNDGQGDATELINRYKRGEQQAKGKEYLKRDFRNAMLAHEHLRWNAYHMLSHYMPQKKVNIDECDTSKCTNAEEIKKAVYESRKNKKTKKHACLTTYNGVMEVGRYLAQKINSIIKEEKYTATDFQFFETDDMLLDESVAVEYIESNGYVVVKKTAE